MSELVSILIPAYNAEQWIADTIRSALSQTWREIEVIVIDDGSRDATGAIARSFEGSVVKVVTQRNMGAAAARNRALELAQGSYIQWLDADDLLGPEKIKSQMEVARRHDDQRLLLSGAWANFMYRQRAAKFRPTPLWQDLSPVEWMIQKWTHNLHMQTATWLVSRELTVTAGPWNCELLGDDDGEYFTRVVLASSGIRFVPNAAVYYRIVGGGRLSHLGRSRRKLEAQARSMEMQIAHLRCKDDGVAVRAAILSYLQTWLTVFYPERPDIVQRLNGIAACLNGTLAVPQLAPKYSWIEKTLGTATAKRLRMEYNSAKSFLLRVMDNIMHKIETQKAK